MTFRLFLFADRDANRVTRLEQSQEKHAKNDFHGPAWKFQAWKYDCRYLEDHPGTNYVAPSYTNKSTWIGVPGKTVSHSSDCAERVIRQLCFFTVFAQGAKVALIRKTCGGSRDPLHLARLTQRSRRERFDERGNKAPGCENVFTGMVFPNVEAAHSYVFGKDGFLRFRCGYWWTRMASGDAASSLPENIPVL